MLYCKIEDKKYRVKGSFMLYCTLENSTDKGFSDSVLETIEQYRVTGSVILYCILENSTE